MRSGLFNYLGTSVYVPWNPLPLFSAAEQGFWYDVWDIATLFQDAAGTIPVTASGDPIGLQLDKSGNGNHRYQTVSADRPIYVVEGGIPRIRYNGINHWFLTDSVDFTATDKMTVGISVVRISSGGSSMFMEMSANYNNNLGSFNFVLPSGGRPTLGRYGTRTAFPGAAGANVSWPVRGAITVAMDFAESDIALGIPIFRYNGASPSLGGLIRPEAGGGTFGDYPFYFGRRGGTSLPFLGDEFSNLVVSRLLSGTELNELDKFSMIRAGLSA